ncbi:hypothetical protein Q31b_40270 [Novipirellula aureliae]|uniref:Uncharacterized protein n=1 Tax=Novipirellula aureliae TaxID=2527966 RepID=A0A5C6DVV0_9BACT|nr:hypothetical protein Q31b_40270 [Novipirellula aureliae]
MIHVAPVMRLAKTGISNPAAGLSTLILDGIGRSLKKSEFHALMELQMAQPKRVTDNGYTTQTHRRCRYHWAQQYPEEGVQ